jgi:glycosyltransferase involved in cell wall biosynthesis
MVDFMENNYSVLMSVYYKEKPEYLYQSMQSIYEQTIATDNFVLVCDGLLNNGLNEVIAEMQQKFGERLYVHRLHKNGGLGNALNVGMKDCQNELIARMDSDDISHRDRCEKELNIFKQYSEVSVVSGIIEEFTGNINNIHSKRVVPQNQNEIFSFAKKRNPFNHPCVMYKKSAVEKVGGYQDFFLLEDYFLWIRMLKDGFIGYNIQEPLLWMRAGSDMYKRRGGLKYILSQKQLFKYMRDIGFITAKEYIEQLVVRTITSSMPNNLREFIFQVILRSK